jgi:muramoyltetrapeptide carboxypeptidase
MGWVPIEGKHLRERRGYLAGSDEERAADFNAAARSADIDAIWCVRGGYGSMRILDAIDFAAWRERPRILLGYSDITALHSALGRDAGIVTFHGPTARGPLTPFSRSSLTRAVVDRVNSCGHAPSGRTLHRGIARGRLVGGNLALLSALSGTRYAPDYAGAIIVLEDVNESVYRVDRMLTQLRLSGALGGCAGIVFGAFTDIPPEPSDAERNMDDVLAEVAAKAGVPCISQAPLGHVNDQWTIPLGAMATLDADACTLDVAL